MIVRRRGKASLPFGKQLYIKGGCKTSDCKVCCLFTVHTEQQKKELFLLRERCVCFVFRKEIVQIV